MPMPEDMPAEAIQVFEALMTFKWLMPLIAVVEIIGGVLIAIPKTRAFADLMILPITVGILLTHLVNMPDGLIMGIVLFSVNLWVLWENKEKYQAIIK